MARRKGATSQRIKTQPVVYTDEQMVDALNTTKGLVYLAAEKLGCAPSTIYRRAQESETVGEKIRRERGRMVDLAEAKLWQQINDGNTTAILFFLKTQAKDRGYIERSEVVNIPADIQDILKENGVSYSEAVTQWHEMIRKAALEAKKPHD